MNPRILVAHQPIKWYAIGRTVCLSLVIFRDLHLASSFLISSRKRNQHRSSSLCSSDTRYEIGLLVSDDKRSVLGPKLHGEIDQLVKDRAKARDNGDYGSADSIMLDINRVELPLEQLRIHVEDISRANGGGAKWKLKYHVVFPKNTSSDSTVLSDAHAALGLAVSAAERNVPACVEEVQYLADCARSKLEAWDTVQESLGTITEDPLHPELTVSKQWIEDFGTEERLLPWMLVEQRLSGRTAGDAAFWFAMAGSTDKKLYDLLMKVCLKEIQRFGVRSLPVIACD